MSRQLILNDSTYKEKLKELEQKMFIFYTGFTASMSILFFLAVDRFKKKGAKSA